MQFHLCEREATLLNDELKKGPQQTRDRNLSRIIARIRDDGPALPDVDEGVGSRMPRQEEARAPADEPAVVPSVWDAVWDAAPPAPRPAPPGRRSPAPSDRAPPELSTTPEDRLQSPVSAQTPARRGWYLSGTLLAAALVTLGVVAALYRPPPQAGSPPAAAGTGDLALRSELANLQGTIAALSERVESLKTVDELRQTVDLGKRLERVSRQVADLAGDDAIPGDLDRRLDQLAEGLDTVAARVEGLVARRDPPKGTGLPDSGSPNPEAVAPASATPAGSIAGAVPGIGAAEGRTAETPTDPAQIGHVAVSRGVGPQLRPEVGPVAVSDAVSLPGPQASLEGRQSETRGSVGTVDNARETEEGVGIGEVPDDGSDPIDRSVPSAAALAEAVDPGPPSEDVAPNGAEPGLDPIQADPPERGRDRFQAMAARPMGGADVDAAAPEGPAPSEAPDPAVQAAPEVPLGEEWVVNLIAVRRESTALDLQRTFRGKGVDSQVLKLPSGLYSVRVGGFGSRTDALAAAPAIGADLGIKDTYVSRR